MRINRAFTKATYEKTTAGRYQLLPFMLLLLHILLMGLLPAPAQAPAAIGSSQATVAAAKKIIIDNIGQQLYEPGAAARFFRHFNGGMQAPAAGWQARFLLLQQQPQAVLDLPVHLLSGKQIRGAYAAFAREGADGQPAIYLNESWLRTYGSVKGLERLLAEELGHALDAYLNQGLETPGDEGEGYALAMQYGNIPTAQKTRVSRENDFSHIVLNNREITVEEAAIYLNEIYRNGSGTGYGLQSNSVTNIQKVTGTGFKFTSANPSDPTFSLNSGNNVGGTLTYINASGSEVSIGGAISRQEQGNPPKAVYFWVSATEVYWLVFPGYESSYANNTTVTTSSNNNFVQTLNSVLAAQQSAPTISVNSPSPGEGDGHALFTISVSPAATSSYTFTPTLTAGTATSGTDFGTAMEYRTSSTASWTPLTGARTFGTAITSIQVRVALTDDNTPESTETFTLNTGTITGGGILNNGGAYGVASIQDNDVAPSGLSYTSPNTFTVGTAITPLSPTVTGAVTSYGVSPGLPAGLSIHNTTGVISGTPTAPSAATSYTVTAANSSGSTTASLSITVITGPPVFTSTPVLTATVGQPYNYSVAASDPGNLPLTMSGVTVPSWLTFSTNGQNTSSQIGGTVIQASGVAGDAAGNIYATGISGTDIYKIAPNGTMTQWFTRRGGAVYGMLVVGNDLYVVYYSKSGHNDDITKINLTGTPTETGVTTALNAPIALTYLNGALYAADFNANKVVKVDIANGNATSDVVSYSGVWGLGFNNAGLLYMASFSGGKVSTVDISNVNPASTITDVITGLSSPTDVKIDANSNIYISGNGFVRKYNQNVSSHTDAWSGSTYAVGMALTPTGALVFGLYGLNQVQKLQTGAILTATPAISNIGVHPVVLEVTNGSQNAQQSFSVSVSGPSTFSLPNITKNVGDPAFSITAPASTNTNGAFSYTSSNPSVATISGNTVTVVGQGTATITATQAPAGLYLQTSNTFTITVSLLAPSALSYTTPNTFVTGTAITPLSPTVTGAVTSYGVSPSLPAGLSIHNTTGVISGTPTALSAATSYTVTATNSSGSVNATVSIETVAQLPAPSILSYTTPNTFTVGTAISPISPVVTGTVTGYTVLPALPAGLSLNATTGIISGTPTTAAATATYVVTATNSSGSTQANVAITVQVAAPSALSYTTPNTFTVGAAITALTPTVTGTATTYSALTPLPAGLSINAATGVISGTPTTAAPATNYTIQATNSTGSTTAVVNIAVQIAAPSALSYTTPNVYTVGTAITPLSPTVTGTVTSYSISPALPAGFILNTTTGAISGTSIMVVPAANYTITATNSTGSVSFAVSIGVDATISYTSPAAPLPVGGPITPIPPAVTGTGYTYAISPGLPAGLVIDPATGIISGTPAGPFAATTFTVTANNGQGTIATTVTLGAAVAPPAALSYSPQTLVLTTGTAMTPLTPALTGTGYSFTISPGLPAGTDFDPATGVISGTPTGTSGTTAYTITATNSGGSINTVVSITVNGTLGAFAPITRTYGDPAFAVSAPAAPAPGTFVYAVADNTIASVSGGTITPLQAGSTTVTATYTFAGGGTVTETTTLVVEPKELIVQPANKTMCAQGIMPALTYTITGFIPGDNSSVLTSQPEAATEANRGSGAGTYPITVSGGSASNYRFTYGEGSLQVYNPANSGMRHPAIDAVAGSPVQVRARSFGSSYQWAPANLLNNATIAAPLATLQQDAELTVRITESSTGCVVTDTLPVRVHLGWQISMPDVFTPNGDGYNDVIKPIMPDMNTFSTFRVFNRWGNVIFETKEQGKGWDGRYQGALQPQETYLWLVEGTDKEGKKVIRRGAFTLLR